jgi:hypothetical protein
MKITFGLVAAAVFFSGCKTEDTLESMAKNLDKLTQTKERQKGVSCEEKDVLEVLKSIVDKKFNGDFQIEKDAIVIWDYNSVGRYTCRARIKKVGERKEKTKLPDNENEAALAILGQIFTPAQFGIGNDGGWINYYTYVTTASSKENRHLYVEIFTEEGGE